MKKFHVEFSINYFGSLEIEAEDRDEAEDKVKTMCLEENIEFNELCIDSVQEISD